MVRPDEGLLKVSVEVCQVMCMAMVCLSSSETLGLCVEGYYVDKASPTVNLCRKKGMFKGRRSKESDGIKEGKGYGGGFCYKYRGTYFGTG